MCIMRFEEKPKKFNAGSGARLIDVLRSQEEESLDRENKQDTLEKVG